MVLSKICFWPGPKYMEVSHILQIGEEAKMGERVEKIGGENMSTDYALGKA